MNLTRKTGTLAGLAAILLWALLALFTVLTGQIPPFQLTAMTFAVAFFLALIKWVIKGQSIKEFIFLPAGLWCLGVGGLFGYHFFYFLALKSAPAAEAGLIAYLWPLLIVLFSSFLPGETLRWFHIVGAMISLIGAGFLITGGQALEIKSEFLLGYGAALVCAFTWSGYSVLSRRYSGVSTDVIGTFCGVTALLALICHLAFEQTLVPDSAGMWVAVLALGIGPVGGAFFLWDMGVKHGDIQGLGVLSYLAPLLSTLLLVILGGTAFTWSLFAGCMLITSGAIIGSLQLIKESLFRGK